MGSKMALDLDRNDDQTVERLVEPHHQELRLLQGPS